MTQISKKEKRLEMQENSLISEINQIELSRLLCLCYLFLFCFQCKLDVLYNQIDSTSSDLFQRYLDLPERLYEQQNS